MSKLPTLSSEQFALVSEAFSVILAEGLTGEAARERTQLHAGGDQAIQATLEQMLKAHETEASRDEFQAAAAEAVRVETHAAGEHIERNIPEKIGAYRVVRYVASGGMGTVYEAEQEHPRRRVAIKVIRLELLTTASVRRFESEGHLLARLRHPGIARVFAMGRMDTPAGSVPYLVLEFIDGMSITDYVQTNRIDRRSRIELLRKVADAVQYAHDNAVLHRDLKPSNVLVDKAGQPHVLDFGIGRALDDERSQASLTATGLFLGTLAYMSPEQAVPTRTPIDVRVDVYGLGAVGYELLAGQPPHAVHDLPLHEAVQLVSQREPRTLASVDPSIDGDLSAILSKALATERQRRYRSVREFDHDLGRYLSHEPVQARPPSRLYLAKKLIRRNQMTFALLTLVVATLIGGLAVSIWQRRVALDAEATATRLATEATKGNRAAVLGAAWAALETHRENEVGDALRRLDTDPEHRPIELRLLRAQALNATRYRKIGALPTGATIQVSPRGDRGVVRGASGALRYVDLDRARCVPLLPPDRTFLNSTLTWSHGENTWLVADTAEQLDVIDCSAHRVARVIDHSSGSAPLDPQSQDYFLWKHATGTRLVDLNAGVFIEDERVQAFLKRKGARLENGQILVVPRAARRTDRLDLRTMLASQSKMQTRRERMGSSPDGRFELVGDRRPVIHDMARGVTWRLIQRGGIGMSAHAFSQDSSSLAILYWDGSVSLWDLKRRALVKKFWDMRLGDAGASRAAVRILSNGDLRTVWRGAVFDWPRTLPATEFEHAGPDVPMPYIYSMAWHPNGRWLASAAWDKRIVIWDTWTGRELGHLRVDAGMPPELRTRENAYVVPEFLDWSPDGRRLVVQLQRHTTVIWDVWTRTVEFSGLIRPSILALENDGVTIGDPGTGAMRRVRLDEAAQLPIASAPRGEDGLPEWVRAPEANGLSARWVDFSRGGQRVVRPSGATQAAEPAFRVWDLSSRAPYPENLWREETKTQCLSARLTSDGKRLFVGQRDGTILLYDVPGRRRLMILHGHQDYVSVLALSPDDTMLASAAGDGRIKLWPLTSSAERVARRDQALAQRDRITPIVQWAWGASEDAAGRYAACMADPALHEEDRTAAAALLFSRMR